MQKVVINSCYGGFGLSNFAVMEFAKAKGVQLYAFKRYYDKEPIIEKPITLDEALTSSNVSFYTTPDQQKDSFYWKDLDIPRNDPFLIYLIEHYGSKKISGDLANLTIVDDIPDDVEWQIEEYDGFEHVAEKHRTWG
jgi:hypothetical protein